MQRRFVSVVAGCALLLATAPLTAIYSGLFEWFTPASFAVALIVAAGIGARALNANAALQILATTATLTLYCTWMFGDGRAFLGVVPTGATLDRFGRLFVQAGETINDSAVPVTTNQGLTFVTVLGLGLCAIIVDALASTFRMVSSVGLPLLTLYVIPVAVLPESIPWLLFIPGALGYMWLLMTDNIDRVRHFGRRYTGAGRGVDTWEPSPLASSGRWIAALMIPLALLLPAALPGVPTGGLLGLFTGNGPGLGPGGTTSTSKVNPVAALQGALENTQVVEVARVRTDNPDPGYMKMYVASTLTEDGFQADLTMSTQSVRADGMLPMMSNAAPGRSYSATFSSVGLADYAIPLYGEPSSMATGGDWMYDPLTSMVASATTTTIEMELSYEYIAFDYQPDDLRTAPAAPVNTTPMLRSNTANPDSAMVADLVASLTEDAPTAYDAVMAIQNHFSEANGFSYELRTKDGWSASAIESFLTEKTGFCQQYAGAMAWMVREANIPARVAIGLTQGSLVASNEYRLTNFNYHAWVEVYFHGFGWVPFDPTPSAQVRNSVEFPWAPDIDAEDPDGTNRPGEEDPADDPAQQPAPTDPGQMPGSAGATVLTGLTPPPIWPLWTTGGAVLALLVLSPAWTRALTRRRRLRTASSNDPTNVDAAWREFEDTLTDLRIESNRARTPRATGDWLVEKRELTGISEAGVRHLVAAVERSRYARTAPEGLTLTRAVDVVRAGLVTTAPPRTALRAALLPTSTLRRWRRRLREARTGVSMMNARLRRRIGRLVRRPSRRRPA